MAETVPDEWEPLSQGPIKEENQTVIRAAKHGAGSEERNKEARQARGGRKMEGVQSKERAQTAAAT